MNNNRVLLVVFVLVALAQLYIPAKMIWDKEEIIEIGQTYKFKTAPIDPTDPFRGKYITLSFIDTRFKVTDGTKWTNGEEIYLSFNTDSLGYANIQSISKNPFDNNGNYLKAKVRYASSVEQTTLLIDYPFDRYYMEESKAYRAEVMYRESQRDTSTTTYALVKIKNGESVLEDVMINGIPIREVVKSHDENSGE